MTYAQSAAIKRILEIIPSDWSTMTYTEQKAFLVGAASACYNGQTEALLSLLVPPIMDTYGFADRPVLNSPSLN
jgi:hypothetical protein